ncbi:uncharacterized protein [Centruroides vittatus]
MDKETNFSINRKSTDEKIDISEEDEKSDVKYVLPVIRFSTIFKIIIVIDWIVCICLWLAGGHGTYFIKNITSFHFTQSVLDLALINTFQAIFLVVAIDYLEHLYLLLLDSPFNGSLQKKKKIVVILIIFLCIGCFAYSVTKGIWLGLNYFRSASYVLPHISYIILIYWTVVLSVCKLISISIYPFNLRHLGTLRRIVTPRDPKPVTLKRLFLLVKPEMNLIFAGTLALLVSSGTTTIAPFYFGKMIDAAQKSLEKLNETVLILLMIYLVGSIASMVRSWLFTLAGQKFVARLRNTLFSAMINQEVAFFDTNRTGELTNRLSSDTQVIQNCVTVNISMLSRNVFLAIGSIIFMFVLSSRLTGVLLAIIPLVSIGIVKYGSYVQKVRKDFQDALASASTVAEENLSSIRTVRSFAGEDKANKLYSKEIDVSYGLGKKLALVQGGFEGVVGFFFFGAIVITMWYGGHLLYSYTKGESAGISPGVLTSFLIYGLQIGMAFGVISSLFGDFMQAVGASFRIFELLDRRPIIPVKGGRTLISPEGKVELKDVYFTYPSRPECPVLNGISLTLIPDKVIALVGPSGGGKSTIATLIERFYDPDSGAVLFDDEDIRELDPINLRQQIARVEQEPVLFACSIYENICYGRDASLEEVKAISKEANAHEFIETFEQGYETLVGERGVRLSGGQKQRVAIARALLTDPKVLLLDEATSALDAESEHLVQEAIERAMKGRSVLVIAHRLSTVKNADAVLVIDQGKIVEMGTHKQLLDMDGMYKKLVLRQLSISGTEDSNDE